MILYKFMICVLITLTFINNAVAQCTWIGRNPVLVGNCPDDDELPFEADCKSMMSYIDAIVCQKDHSWVIPGNGLTINLYDAEDNPFHEKVTPIVNLRMIRGTFADIPSKILEMTKLKELKIFGNNRIRSVKFNDFLQLAKLKKIDLSNNNISIIEVTTPVSKGYSNVEDIDVSNNAIEVIPNNFLGQFRNLESLNLSHNIISNINLHSFEGTVQLKTLDLSYNRLHEIGDVLGNIPKLHDPNYGPWTNLGTLSTLILDNNFLSVINLADFYDTEISKLSIGGNQIPCDILTNAKYSNYSETFDRIVTAITPVCRSKNVNGIACKNSPSNRSDSILDPSNLNANPIILLLKNAIENNTKTVNELVEVAQKNEKAIEDIEHIVKSDNRRLNSTDSKLLEIINVLGDMKKCFPAREGEELVKEADVDE